MNILAECHLSTSHIGWVDLIHIGKAAAITSYGDIGVSSSTASVIKAGGQIPVSNVNGTVTVKNFGTTHVQAFSVHFTGNGIPPGCISSGVSKHVNHVLAPGDSIVVALPSFQTIAGQYCFYTNVPNSTHDVFEENDKFCDPVIIAGTHEAAAESLLNVYPNPARDAVFIESEKPIHAVEIEDPSGRLVLRINETGSALSRTLSLSAIPHGVYLLRVFVGETSFHKRIVIYR